MKSLSKLGFVYTIIAIILFFLCWTSCQTEPYKQGRKLYELHCQNCHQKDGNALMALIPPLAGSDYLIEHQEDLPCNIRHGMKHPIIVNGMPYEGEMPANKILTETQIANVINYINNAWGNKGPYVSYEDVLERLEKCKK